MSPYDIIGYASRVSGVVIDLTFVLMSPPCTAYTMSFDFFNMNYHVNIYLNQMVSCTSGSAVSIFAVTVCTWEQDVIALAAANSSCEGD